MSNPNAKSAVLIDSYTISTAVSSVVLTGMTSEYSLYQVFWANVRSDNPGSYHAYLSIRFQESGVSNTSSIYDTNGHEPYGGGSTVSERINSNLDKGILSQNSKDEQGGAVLIFNSQDNTEYTYYEAQNVGNGSGYSRGDKHLGAFKTNSIIDGVELYDRVGNNLGTGYFALYGYK